MKPTNEREVLGMTREEYVSWRSFREKSLRHYMAGQPMKGTGTGKPPCPYGERDEGCPTDACIDAGRCTATDPCQAVGGEAVEPRRQVGGDHYARLKIQPVDYMLANGMGYCEGNVVKYVSRWREKGGVEDLEKAKQYLQFLIDAEKK